MSVFYYVMEAVVLTLRNYKESIVVKIPFSGFNFADRLKLLVVQDQIQQLQVSFKFNSMKNMYDSVITHRHICKLSMNSKKIIILCT